MKNQWDSTSLITCAKFKVEERLVLDYALDAGNIVITTDVYEETVEAGLQGRYPDAVEIKKRVDSGHIQVRSAAEMNESFEEVMDLYGLHKGDKAVVRMSLQENDVERTITDDRLLFIVLCRSKRKALFLPDFIEKAVELNAFDATMGEKLLLSIQSRLSIGIVEHSLRRLKGVI